MGFLSRKHKEFGKVVKVINNLKLPFYNLYHQSNICLAQASGEVFFKENVWRVIKLNYVQFCVLIAVSSVHNQYYNMLLKLQVA